MAPNQLEVISQPAVSVAEEARIEEKEKHGDRALAFLNREEVGNEHEYVDEKKLRRKIDWMVMPLMFACYFLEYLDKSLRRYCTT